MRIQAVNTNIVTNRNNTKKSLNNQQSINNAQVGFKGENPTQKLAVFFNQFLDNFRLKSLESLKFTLKMLKESNLPENDIHIVNVKKGIEELETGVTQG